MRVSRNATNFFFITGNTLLLFLEEIP